MAPRLQAPCVFKCRDRQYVQLYIYPSELTCVIIPYRNVVVSRDAVELHGERLRAQPRDVYLTLRVVG